MNIVNLLKIIELCVLGFLFPVTIVFFELSQFILLFLWSITLYAVIILVVFYRNSLSLNTLFYINFNKNKAHLLLIISRWIILSTLLYIFTVIIFPDKLFLIQKNDVSLLYKIFVFYPLLSALPQEFIFCTFFFIRYKSLFNQEKKLVLTSAIIFCFAHIFSINWVAPFLSLFGGFIFANTYKKTKSLFFASFEHALYGNSLFAIGLGWFFWGGSVV